MVFKWDKVDKAYEFLKTKEKDNVSFTLEELSEYTGWKDTAIRTYISKRLYYYIQKVDKKFYICNGLVYLTLNNFRQLLTQKVRFQEVPCLIKKARQFALLAVVNYNNPTIEFRIYSYIVNIIIAWTSLFHAVFEKEGKDYFYKDNKTNDHIIIDGEKQAWDLSECILQYWQGNCNPVRDNLRLLIGLRNKIEHRYLPALDIMCPSGERA